MSLCPMPECQTTAGCKCARAADEIDRKEIIAKLEAEIERLTAENAELRAALQIWMQGRTLEQTHDQTQGQK